MSNWTDEQRDLQRARIAKHRPWDNSTGAKTAEGKQRSAQNANKGKGDLREIRKLIASIHRERLEVLKVLKVLKQEYGIMFKTE